MSAARMATVGFAVLCFPHVARALDTAEPPACGGEANPCPPPDPDRDPGAVARRRGLAVRGTAAVAYRNVYGVPIVGGEVDFGVGYAWPAVALYGGAGLFAGATVERLPVQQLMGAFTVESGSGSPLRVGFSPHLVLFLLERQTSRATIVDFGIGAQVHLTVDIARIGWNHVFVGVRAGGDVYAATGALLGNFSGFAGLRY